MPKQLLITIAAVLGICVSAAGQMSPEEAMKGLGGSGGGDESGADEKGGEDFSSYKWRIFATRISRFFYEVEGQYHCNTYHSTRWSRVAREAMGSGGVETRRKHKLPVGIFHDTSSRQRRAISEPYTYRLSDAEVFARQQAIGAPEAGNFGFIRSARVKRVIDDDTLELTDIKLVEEDMEEEYDKLINDAGAWGWDMYVDLRKEYSRLRREIRAEDRFEPRYPDSTELTNLREGMIEEMFEGRMRMLEFQERWEGTSLIVHGVDGRRYKRNAIETWEDSSTQLILTKRRGRTLEAITPSLARKAGIDRDELLKVVKKADYEPGRFCEMVEKLKERRDPDHSTWRRAALILAGRAVREDRPIAREYRGSGG